MTSVMGYTVTLIELKNAFIIVRLQVVGLRDCMYARRSSEWSRYSNGTDHEQCCLITMAHLF